MIFHRDAAVAVERFDFRLRRIVRRIQNRPDEGNMPAADFRIRHDETVRFPVVADAIDSVSVRVGDQQRLPFYFVGDLRHEMFLAAVHVVNLVSSRNFHGLCRRTALNLGIDIEIARADENISVRLDAGIIKRRFAPVGIHRIAAHARDAAVFVQIGDLDVIAVLYVDLHRAGVDMAVIGHVAVVARDMDAPARIVDVAGQCDAGRHVNGRAVIVPIRRGSEFVCDGNGRCLRVRRRLRRKGNGLCRIFIDGFDLIGDRLVRRFQLFSVVIDVSALVRPGRAAAAHNFDVADDQLIRRIVRDGDRRVRRRRKRAAAVHIVPFEENIAQLRRDLSNRDIMRHLSVFVCMEKVIRTVRPFGHVGSVSIDYDTFRAIIPEYPVFILRTAVLEECLRRRNLISQLIDILQIRADSILTIGFLIAQKLIFTHQFRAADFFRIADEIPVIRIIVVCQKRGKIRLDLCHGLRRRRFRRLRTFPIRSTLIVFLDQFRIGVLRNIRFRRQIFLLRRLIDRRRQLIVFLVLLFGLDLRLQKRRDGIVILRLLRFHLRKLRDLRIGRIQFLIHFRQEWFTVLHSMVVRHFRINEFGTSAVRHTNETLASVRQRLEIAKPFFDHFLFEESQLSFVRRFGRLAAAVILQELLELVIAREEIAVDRFRYAVCIRNIAVARDRRDPFPVRPDTAADRNRFVSVNARLGLAVHFRIGRDGDFAFPDRIPGRKGIANRARPRFRFPGRFRREIPFIGAQINIPIAAQIGRGGNRELRVAGDFRKGILAVRDGNGRCAQQIAVRPRGDLAGLPLRIAPASDGNIALGRLRRRAECRL